MTTPLIIVIILASLLLLGNAACLVLEIREMRRVRALILAKRRENLNKIQEIPND